MLNNKKIEMLQLFHAEGCPCVKNHLHLAVKLRKTQYVNFFIEKGIEILKKTMKMAVKNKDLEIFKILQKKTPKLVDYQEMNILASKGYLEGVQFLDCIGYKGDQQTFQYGANSGNLELVKFMLEYPNKFPFDADLIFKLLPYGGRTENFVIFRYLYEKLEYKCTGADAFDIL